MSRLFILCVVLWIAVNRTLASMWVDPDWAKMLKESELIVLVEVVEGGTYVAKVRPISAFKGKIGSEFYVTGFNNISWPADAISTESFMRSSVIISFYGERKMQCSTCSSWQKRNRVNSLAPFPLLLRRSQVGGSEMTNTTLR